MTHEACPHCGQSDPRSVAYRCGERAGRKVIEKCAGDERLRTQWLKFLVAFQDMGSMAPAEVADFLEAARATVEAGATGDAKK